MLAGRWWPAYSRICLVWILSPLKKKRKKRRSWTPSDKTFWIRTWMLPVTKTTVSTRYCRIRSYGICIDEERTK